jgi:hypothetical protein
VEQTREVHLTIPEIWSILCSLTDGGACEKCVLRGEQCNYGAGDVHDEAVKKLSEAV